MGLWRWRNQQCRKWSTYLWICRTLYNYLKHDQPVRIRHAYVAEYHYCNSTSPANAFTHKCYLHNTRYAECQRWSINRSHFLMEYRSNHRSAYCKHNGNLFSNHHGYFWLYIRWPNEYAG